MSVFAHSIAADQHRPSEGDGFVRAETIQQAVALIGQPTFGAECRFTGAFQTFRWHAAKVGS
jgi:hypothetical protein